MADEPVTPHSNRRLGVSFAGLGIVWAILITTMTLASCGGPSVPGPSPDYDSPKEAGKSYVEFREKCQTVRLETEREGRDTDLSYYKDYENLYEDKEEWKKQFAKQENWVKVFKENKSKLLEFKPEDEAEEAEKEGDRETGRKIYKCTVKRQRLVESGDDNWKLEEKANKYNILLAKIDGKWLIVKAGVE